MAKPIPTRRPPWPLLALKVLLLFLLLILLALAIAFARRPPRIETTEPLFQGVTYARYIRSIPRKMLIHIVEVDLTAPGVRVLVSPGDSSCGMETCAQTTAEFLEKEQLQVAINGSFFDPFSVGTNFWNYYPHTNDPTNVIGLAISNGVQYSSDFEGFAILCFIETQALIAEKRCPTGTSQAIPGRQILVRDGAPVHFDYADKIHPRTAVAVGDDGRRLWLIAVDGRQDGYSEGIDLNELAELITQLGAAAALNLDGGGSTTLVTSRNGVRTLNAPIHTRIPMRQRPVANHLGIYALPLP